APSRFGVDNPLCYLTTTGRKSGTQRTVPLFYVTVDRDLPSFAVAASNWGKDSHPGWSANLEAHPNAVLDIEGIKLNVLARRASEEETLDIWNTFDGVWPGYETYRDMAPRDIRVFVLEAETG
ncbi:MAG: nitroreductase family deazaflavin-dependent oxidoreductase, partial [Acidimicrobiia bacterium]